MAECDHRIDSCRPPRGNVAGSVRDAHEHEQNGTNREWIERAHIEKLAHQNTSESQGNNQSRKQAKTRSKDSIASDKSKDIVRLGAKRHADADFARALHDHVGHQAINSDCGEKKCQCPKPRQQRHREAPLRQ
jgi:hypothetical protein